MSNGPERIMIKCKFCGQLNSYELLKVTNKNRPMCGSCGAELLRNSYLDKIKSWLHILIFQITRSSKWQHDTIPQMSKLDALKKAAHAMYTLPLNITIEIVCSLIFALFLQNKDYFDDYARNILTSNQELRTRVSNSENKVPWPLSCDKITQYNSIDLNHIECNVITDVVSISNVIYNRGNCISSNDVISEMKNTPMGHGLFKIIAYRFTVLPAERKFGDKVIFAIPANCNLLEATIEVDNYTYTWKFLN